MSKSDRSLRRVVQFVNNEGGRVSVREIADALGISESWARTLAIEAIEQGYIDGDKVVPVIGYVFGRNRARTDGGDDTRQGDLRVIPTREGLLDAVQDYGPHRVDEARGMTLDELRKFVRDHVADDTVPVTFAWRFWPN